MHSALLGLGQTPCTGRRIAVLADMKELGQQSQDLHQSLAHSIAECDIDIVLTLGTEIKALYQALPASHLGVHFTTLPDLQSHLLNTIQEGDVVMIKGSNAMKLSHLVKVLTNETETQQQGEA